MPGNGNPYPIPSSSRGLYRRTNGDDDDGEEDIGSIIPDRAGKQSFCRLCLTHSEGLNPLFPANAAPDQGLLSQILDCVDVEITLPEDIRSFICVECVQQIYSFANFKKLCKSNDQLLKSQACVVSDSDSVEPLNTPSESNATAVTSASIKEDRDTISNSEESFTPDISLLEKLYEQGVEVETLGQPNPALQGAQGEFYNAEEREAERKAKNAARMRRWRMRQRQKQAECVVQTQEKFLNTIDQNCPVQLKQEDALRIQQAQEMFAMLARQQLRQVEAEIKRLKEGGHLQQEELPTDFAIKEEAAQEGESSRQTSPTSDQQMAAVRRSRAEYMRRWRAKRQQTQQQNTSFGFVGRPPALSPVSADSERLIIQRHMRAEYMRRWRRERLKQELSPGEFQEWCAKSEQRRRFREWQTRESASSAGDDTMDCGENESEKNVSFDALQQHARTEQS